MKHNVKITRDKNGIPHVQADNLGDMFWGQGYVHAKDRGLQILLMRILGQGRGSELLVASDEMFQIDLFFRKMNWSGNIEDQINTMKPDDRGLVEEYCNGINDAFKEKYPWEFKLLGYKPESWIVKDVIMISRMIGYLTLAQSQAEIERLFVEMVQAGVSGDKLEELFPGLLGGFEIDLIKQIKLQERIVKPETLWNIAIPRMMASNNWVISGEKSLSGKPILSNDPHLEVNRLPNVWQEIVLESEGKYMMGGAMPGVPGVLVGRNSNVSWGATYAFADAVDSWVEKCKDGKYFRENEEWIEFRVRKEIIKRKKGESKEVVFYENRHGVLEGDPFKDGYYLSSRWAAGDSGGLSISAILGMWHVKTVKDGINTMGRIETAWNFVFADVSGNIGFQMTGIVPKRREGISGFIPLPGWKKENDWTGFYDITDMPHQYNPKKGFIVTANNDLNKFGKSSPLNMPMGPYRADRIASLLEGKNDFSINDFFSMHSDLYSLQAEYFMKILNPLLSDSSNANILKEWDLKYDVDSKGAYLFEEFYKELFRIVFGAEGLGEKAVKFLFDETGTFVDFYANFDRILLSEESLWFGGKNREELFKTAFERIKNIKVKKWGRDRKFIMSHMLFGRKLPRFLGFDRGPITGEGGRATIHQGQIYKSAGRVTTFMPSFRIVVDMSSNEIYSNLAGGPSDRRFSKWYYSDMNRWLNGEYKKINI